LNFVTPHALGASTACDQLFLSRPETNLENAVSTASVSHKRLSSTAMAMSERVLKKMENSLPGQSIDVEPVATLLLREFHQGVHEEADLLTNFVGEVRPNSQLRKVKTKNSDGDGLDVWADDGGAAAVPLDRPT
jgi:hypothetical protein